MPPLVTVAVREPFELRVSDVLEVEPFDDGIGRSLDPLDRPLVLLPDESTRDPLEWFPEELLDELEPRDEDPPEELLEEPLDRDEPPE